MPLPALNFNICVDPANNDRLFGVAAIVYLVLSVFFPQSILVDGSDGFTSSMIYVLEGQANFLADTHFVTDVHTIRALVVAPFLVLHFAELDLIQNILLFLLALPFYYYFRRTELGWLVMLVPFLCFFGSVRAVLAALSLGYLWLFIFRNANSYLLYFLSCALSILSSGLVVVWVVIQCLYYRRVLLHASAKVTATCLLLVLLLPSVGHKIHFFEFLEPGGAEVESGYSDRDDVDASNVDASSGSALRGIYSMTSRATIVRATKEGDWPRVVIYIGVFFLLVAQIVYSWRCHYRIDWFFLVAIPFFFVEGLPFISFVVAIALATLTRIQETNRPGIS